MFIKYRSIDKFLNNITATYIQKPVNWRNYSAFKSIETLMKQKSWVGDEPDFFSKLKIFRNK